MKSGKRIIMAGGGTGGHIFPAIAIANALKAVDASVEILFVGAKGKMEMEKVPQAGYKIEGLTIAGFNRSSLFKNIALPFKLMKSFIQVSGIFSRFKPDAVVGVGGYSSFPVLKYAQVKRLPTFIHEANSYGGKSNILLAKKATAIFTATDGMEKFFPADKIIVSGNPVRQAILHSNISKDEGCRKFGLDPNRKVILFVGGSLGARSINEAVDKGLDEMTNVGLQVIWQTGKPYRERGEERGRNRDGVFVNEFISAMEYAYAAADIVVSRSGAMALSELCVVKKPAILVPFPFAAEDHQTANAQNLAKRQAAIVVKDEEAKDKLVKVVKDLTNDFNRQIELSKNISNLAVINADKIVAEEILNRI